MRIREFLSYRVRVGVGACICGLALLLAGCGGGGGGGVGSAGGEIQGAVQDSLQGDQGVSGATVTIGGKTTTTGTSGSFDLTGIPLGTSTAVVTPPGSAASQTIAFQPAVSPGTTSGIVLLLNIGQISGKVMIIPKGSSTPQAAANAVIVDNATGIYTQAASDGTFLLDEIPATSPATARSITFVAGPANSTQSIPIGYGLNNIGTITLTDPGTSPPPGLPTPTITGTVTLGDTSGLAPGTPVILLRNGIQTDAVQTDQNGVFNFYAPAGSGYTIQVIRSAYQTANIGPFSVTNPSTALTENVTLQPNP